MKVKYWVLVFILFCRLYSAENFLSATDQRTKIFPTKLKRTGCYQAIINYHDDHRLIKTEDDSVLTKANFNFLFGAGLGYIFPYAEIGLNYKSFYITGELGYMVLGGWFSWVTQYEFLSVKEHSMSLVGNYGNFFGIGDLWITIYGGGLEYRIESLDSKIQVLARFTIQLGLEENPVPVLQAGIRLNIPVTSPFNH